MLKFRRDELYDLLRFTISYTTDEKIMLRAWRLFRSRTKAPLFPVELSYEQRVKEQATMNRVTIETMADHGLSVRDISRLTGLHRTTIHRHVAAYRSLSDAERRATRQRDGTAAPGH